MSIVDRDGVRVEPEARPEDGSGVFRAVCPVYIMGDPRERQRRARRLCVLALRQIHAVPVEVIGLAFGLHKGQISRMAHQAAGELRSAVQTHQFAESIVSAASAVSADQPAAGE